MNAIKRLCAKIRSAPINVQTYPAVAFQHEATEEGEMQTPRTIQHKISELRRMLAQSTDNPTLWALYAAKIETLEWVLRP